MLIELNYYNLSLFLGGFIALLSGPIVYYNDPKDKGNIGWLLLNIATSVWSFAYGIMISASNYQIGWISNVILHAGAICIPLFYFLFILGLTNQFDKYRIKIFIASLFSIAFLFLNLTEFFVRDVKPKFIFNYVPDAGPLYIYFTAYFFILVIYALVILARSASLKENIERKKLLFVLFSSLAGFIGGGSVFFLTFNINIPPHPIVFFSLYPLIITYAILKHHLFNVKVVSTELFSALLVFILSVRFILSEGTRELSFNGFILLSVGIVSFFLIRSFIEELKRKEQIETLNLQLQKSVEELRKMDEVKSEFVNLASHQLRTPLTPIKGFSEMLLDGSLGGTVPNDEQKNAVKIINDSAKRMSNLIDDLLDVSKLEKEGGFAYKFVVESPEASLKKLIDDFQMQAKEKGLKLSYESHLAPETKLKFDQLKFSDAIGNIIHNAIKYTLRGNVWVTVTEDQSDVIITVKDTGVGIDKDDIPKIFQKFFRGKEVSRLQTEGTGLGLYFTRRVIEDHGGHVWVQSEGLEKGTEFIAKLPKAKEGQPQDPSPTLPPVPPPPQKFPVQQS